MEKAGVPPDEIVWGAGGKGTHGIALSATNDGRFGMGIVLRRGIPRAQRRRMGTPMGALLERRDLEAIRDRIDKLLAA